MPAKKKKTQKGKAVEVDSDEQPVRSVKRRKDCPDCGSTNINFDPETEQLICQDCGQIFEELPGEAGKYSEDEDLV